MLIGIVFILSILNVGTGTIEFVIEWGASLLAGAFASLVEGMLVDGTTGGKLQIYLLVIPLSDKLNISITVATIVTFIVKLLIFD